MKYLFFAGLLAGMTLLTGCIDTPPVATSNFKITFKALYDGQPLEKYKAYDYDTYRVLFTRYSTFLSDLTLLNGSDEVKMSEIEWVNFTPDTLPTNLSTAVPLSFAGVPDGYYTGLRFGFGVKPELNSRQPKDFAAGHPLHLENEYWLNWQSYIFSKIEGLVDLDKDNTPDAGLEYHCGSNAVYRIFTYNLEIKVEPGATATVEIDLKKIFNPGGSWLDLHIPANQRTSNEADDVATATILVNNYAVATTVKQP